MSYFCFVMSVTCSLVYQVFLPIASYEHFERTYVPSTLNVLISEGIQDFVENEAAKAYGRNRLKNCYVACIQCRREEGFCWFVTLGGKRHNATTGYYRGLHVFLKSAILHRVCKFFNDIEANEDSTILSSITVRPVDSVSIPTPPSVPPPLPPPRRRALAPVGVAAINP